MKKYNCSKVLDYVHEKERMCKSFNECGECGLRTSNCHCVSEITQEHINEVQKWSDEHPVKTRQEVFLEMFPEVALDDYGVVDIQSCKLSKKYREVRDDGFVCGNMSLNCNDCMKEFWNEPYEENKNEDSRE